MDTAAIVESLRGQAAQLRQAGLSDQDFATELAYLLFLKLLDETGAANELPEGYRWKDLTAKRERSNEHSMASCSCGSAPTAALG